MIAMAGVVALAGAGLVGGPFVIGTMAEQKVADMAKASDSYMESMGFPGGIIEVTGYQKGWFSSSANWKTALTLATPEGEKSFTIEQPMTIRHGPVFFGRDGMGLGLAKIEMEAELVNQMGDLFAQMGEQPADVSMEGEYVLQQGVTVGFDGNAALSCAGEPGTLQVLGTDGQRFDVTIGNSSCSGTMNLGDLATESRVTIDNVTVTSSTGETPVSMDGLLFDGDVFRFEDEIPVISYQFKIDRITGDKMNVADVALLSDMAVDADRKMRITSNLDLAMVEFDLPDEQRVTAGPITFHSAASDVSVDTYREYLGLVQKILAQGDYDENGELTEEAAAALLTNMMAVGEAILKDGLGIEISNLSMAMPGHGQADGTMTISLPAGTRFDPEQPNALLNQFTGNAKIGVDRDLAIHVTALSMKGQPMVQGATAEELREFATATVDQTVAQLPYLELDGGRIVATAALQDGALTINELPPLRIDDLIAAANAANGAAPEPETPGVEETVPEDQP